QDGRDARVVRPAQAAALEPPPARPLGVRSSPDLSPTRAARTVTYGAGVALPVRPPFDPMLAKLTREMPPAGAVSYEPEWDGFRCAVSRAGDALDLQSRNQNPLLRYSPELREPLLEQLPEQVVLDGELVVANERGLDFDALQLRQHPAESRIKKLAAEIPAS